ncbi:MAG: DEAD/DEAH box helicase, partial [Candidatus Binataceae bacterium]
MNARVIIAGQAGNVAQLTYAIPPALEGRVACGHRVLVPLRSRRMTGLVVEVGTDLESGGATPKAIIELLEPRPLFDRAHLQLIEFMASYYLAPIGEAYRSVIPAVARVESRRLYKLGRTPDALALAAFTALERAILDAVAARSMTARQIRSLGNPAEADSAIVRLCADGLVEAYDSTRGRHRATTPAFARLITDSAAPKLRGRLQRTIYERLAGANSCGVSIADLEAALPGARPVLRTMVQRGIAEMITHEAGANNAKPGDDSPPSAESDEDTHTELAIAGPAFDLSWEQAATIAEATPTIRDRRGQTFLLWGVTASGKTEVYLQLAAIALAEGRQVLVLVPEIALADQVVKAFRLRFGPLVGIAHSAQNVSDRWANWMDALSGRSRIMIGPRSAVFAPLNDLG